MSLEVLRPQDITEQGLRNLITAQVPEGKVIDYKRELPGNTESARKEFLADLSSFANAAGGHLVYGMAEDEGLPTALTGLSGDIDQAILRLESMARDGIWPPIGGLESARVSLSGGNSAIVIHVPRSWNRPHQVIFQKDFRFYTRGSAGRQHLDVDELRRIVLQSEEIGERVRQFRAGRLAAIIADDTPVALKPGARQILHFVPFTAFGAGTSVDLNTVASHRTPVIQVMNRGGSMRHNVDGLIAYSQSGEGNDAYAQLYRNGILEIAVYLEELLRRGRVFLPSLTFERDVFAQAGTALAVLELAGVSPPVAVMLSFVGIKGWEIGVHDPFGVRGEGGFDRDPLLIPELIVQSFEIDDVQRLVRPIIDATWNAAGYPKSDHYDEQGDWVGGGPR
jgi:hypothetical protein